MHVSMYARTQEQTEEMSEEGEAGCPRGGGLAPGLIAAGLNCSMYVCMYVCMHACMCVCLYEFLCLCRYACLGVNPDPSPSYAAHTYLHNCMKHFAKRILSRIHTCAYTTPAVQHSRPQSCCPKPPSSPPCPLPRPCCRHPSAFQPRWRLLLL